MNIRGIPGHCHDSAVVVTAGDRLAAVTQEIRLSRKEQELRFPAQTTRYWLKERSADASAIDLVFHFAGNDIAQSIQNSSIQMN
jgi:predicted NodU family carbamoyl transferase